METVRRRKLLRRFYEPVLLLHALDPIRGDRIKASADHIPTSPNIQKIRRDFVNAITYICAYQKGSPYVTAAALERAPEGVRVWLAANANIAGFVVDFLRGVLSDIQRIAELEGKTNIFQEGERLNESLTSRIVAFNAPRLRTYFPEAKKRHVRSCLQIFQTKRERISRPPDSHAPAHLIELKDELTYTPNSR